MGVTLEAVWAVEVALRDPTDQGAEAVTELLLGRKVVVVVVRMGGQLEALRFCLTAVLEGITLQALVEARAVRQPPLLPAVRPEEAVVDALRTTRNQAATGRRLALTQVLAEAREDLREDLGVLAAFTEEAVVTEM